VSRRLYALAVAVGLVLLAATAALPNVQFLDAKNVGDTSVYHAYGTKLLHGKLPYRDYFDEYPPGALPVFAAPAIVSGRSYTKVSQGLQWVLAACALILAGRAAQRVRAGALGVAAIGLTPALLGRVTFARFDWWPAALLTAALVLLLEGRDRWGPAVLACAVAAKVYPVVALPATLLHIDRRSGRRAAIVGAGVFAAVLGLIVLPFAALGPGGVGYSLYLEFRRPLQVESLGASFLLVAHRLGLYTPHVVSTYGSQNLSGALPTAVSALTTFIEALALVALWIRYARGDRGGRALGVTVAASVVAFVAFGKVLSPQYLIWLAPLVPLVARKRALLLLGAAMLLTQTWSQSHYHDVVHLHAIVWVVFIRDLILVALFATAAQRA
jgi:glycosyl transferase family 87